MKDWLDTIEARSRAQSKYDKQHTTGFYMKLNLHTDMDIIRWFWKQSSKQGAVKELIREAIAKEESGIQESGREEDIPQ